MTGTSVPKNQSQPISNHGLRLRSRQAAAEMRINTAAAVAVRDQADVFGQRIKHRQMHRPNRFQQITPVSQDCIFKPQR